MKPEFEIENRLLENLMDFLKQEMKGEEMIELARTGFASSSKIKGKKKKKEEEAVKNWVTTQLLRHWILFMACNTEPESEAWITLLWNIENFSYCWLKRNEGILSPDFHVKFARKTVWWLSLYPQGLNNDNYISSSLHVSRMELSENIQVEYDFAILADDGSFLKKGLKEKKTFTSGSFAKCIAFAKREEVMETKRDIFLSQDTLRVRCRLWMTDGKAVAPMTAFARTKLRIEKRNFLWDIQRFSSPEPCHKDTYIIMSEWGDDKVTLNIEVKENKIIIFLKILDEDVKFLSFQTFITDTIGGKIDCRKSEIRPNMLNADIMYLLSTTKNYLMDNENLYLKNDILTLYCEYSSCNGYAFSGVERIDFGITSPYASNPIIPESRVNNQSVNQTIMPKCDVIIQPVRHLIVPEIDFNKQPINQSIIPKYGVNKQPITQQIKSKCDVNKQTIIPEYDINKQSVNQSIIPDANVLCTEVRQSSNSVDLKKDLECLYVKGILCDVKLCTTTQTFHAHKIILSARSPVFQLMFETNMKEKTQERVDIPDLDDDTVRRMLLYVYTDGLKNLHWKSALRLYYAADKYEILSLKNKCSHLLKESLCPSNVGEVINLADMHHDAALKEAAQRYALEHDDDVFDSDEWIEFMKINSALAAETMYMKWNKRPLRIKD
ncbi:hypothetical protein NPIL_205531 [Nephila pilipes]|uniref:Uncharacterized protein n=1 Tax=Nephila pilipes TaxID=299642 RepID=A0A8X6I3B1_NEPPI|nr:hypothetical protein NPIL_205531 [Nephila pilipes]